MNKFVLSAAALVIAFLSGSAGAAPRTVCYQVQLADDRYNCPVASAIGERRACSRAGNVDAVGHQIELWDKDPTGGDEMIGTWNIGGSGTRCITFEWEGGAYSMGEPHPDLYLRYINSVIRTGHVNYVTVKAVTTTGGAHPATSWRNGPTGDPDRYVAVNCTAGTTCYMFPSGRLVPTNDIASPRALRIMALDSAQHALQAVGEQLKQHIQMHYPGQASCPTSCAVDRGNFHIAATQGADGILVGHEIGHVLQMQRFNQDFLRDDLGKSGAGWNLTSDEYDSGATTEGFASYVGIVSWFDPNRLDTVPVGWGLNFETATPNRATCAANRGIPLQVAKGFWDFDDWNNEAGAGITTGWNDSISYGTEYIVTGWDQFPNGTGNRQDYENDQDGVNMRDFYENTRTRFIAPGYFTSLVEHNCLQSQTNS